MSDDVIVKDGEVLIKPINLLVRYDSEKFEIVFQGDTKLFVDGDFQLGAAGEIALMTRGESIHLDSVDGQIHLNSRRSKLLRDLPESKTYLEEMHQRDKELALAQQAGDCEGCGDGAESDGGLSEMAVFRRELNLLKKEVEELKKCQVVPD